MDPETGEETVSARDDDGGDGLWPRIDTRVDPGQSREMYRHLKLRGKAPVRLVNYPGEGHGNRKAGARCDYNLRRLRWFDHYLKGDGGDPPDWTIDYDEHLPEKETEEGVTEEP